MRARFTAFAVVASATLVCAFTMPAVPAMAAESIPCQVNGVDTLGTHVGNRAIIEGTDGNDIIKCHAGDNNDGEEPITVNAGAGEDDVYFGGVYGPDLKGEVDIVNLGAGNDKFLSYDSVRPANYGIINGDDGDDAITLGVAGYIDYAVANAAEVHGGNGNDTLIFYGGYGGPYLDQVSEANNALGVVTGDAGDDIITLHAGRSGVAPCGDIANVGLVDGGDGKDAITLIGGEPDARTCFDEGGSANGIDINNLNKWGVVTGGKGMDKITLTGGVNKGNNKQGPSNEQDSTVDGGGPGEDGATCIFTPAPQEGSIVRNCTIA
ncbi:hypothetical protein M8C13_38500 [Crossiella sp. SN42]|uniref:hypothetical protein n=1 Tax=Crossiella sp. SN42 TaxID=2944808 RepID=UPI00207C6F06|nr:hypothetical protein [Crossiella sp. SN42]MCO1581656.1 hypothetical protein [Crossiella sp. SN42]